MGRGGVARGEWKQVGGPVETPGMMSVASSPSPPPPPLQSGGRQGEPLDAPPQTLGKARTQPEGVSTLLSLGELYCFHTECPWERGPARPTPPLEIPGAGDAGEQPLDTHPRGSKSGKKEAAERATR